MINEHVNFLSIARRKNLASSKAVRANTAAAPLSMIFWSRI